MNAYEARQKWANVVYELNYRARIERRRKIREAVGAVVACLLLLAMWEGFIYLWFWAASR
jgi:hypothetical protein